MKEVKRGNLMCAVLPTPRFTCQIGLLCHRIKKLLGRWPKIGVLFTCLLAGALFSSNLLVSHQFIKLSLFNVQKHSCHHFHGFGHPAITQLGLFTSPTSQQWNCFSIHWVILVTLWLKSTHIWEIK